MKEKKKKMHLFKKQNGELIEMKHENIKFYFELCVKISKIEIQKEKNAEQM